MQRIRLLYSPKHDALVGFGIGAAVGAVGMGVGAGVGTSVRGEDVDVVFASQPTGRVQTALLPSLTRSGSALLARISW